MSVPPISSPQLVRRSLILSTAVVIALAGCTPADVAPTSTPSPSSSTPAPEPAPFPRLALTCDDLYSEAEATAFVGQPVSLKLDEVAVRNVREVAALQDGLLSCTWGGESTTDGGWDEHLVVDVLPDADQAFDVGVWQVDDGATVYPAGSLTSEYRCGYANVDPAVGYLGYYCVVNVLVDGFWGQADLQGTFDDAAGADALPALEARLRELVDSLTLAIASAGEPNPAWVPPSGALTGAICSGSAEADILVSAPDQVAEGRAGVRGCEISSLKLVIAPGGAWAYPVLESRADRPWYAGSTVEPVEVDGVGPALLSCGDGCMAVVAVGGSLVSVYDSDNGEPAPLLTTLPDIISQIIAAG